MGGIRTHVEELRLGLAGHEPEFEQILVGAVCSRASGVEVTVGLPGI